MKNNTLQKFAYVAAFVVGTAAAARAQTPPAPPSPYYTPVQSSMPVPAGNAPLIAAVPSQVRIAPPPQAINVEGYIYSTGYALAPQAVVIGQDIRYGSLEVKKGDVYFPLGNGDMVIVHGKDITVRGDAGTRLTDTQAVTIGVLAQKARDQYSADHSPPVEFAYPYDYGGGLPYYNYNAVIPILTVGPLITFNSPFFSGYSGGGRGWFPFGGGRKHNDRGHGGHNAGVQPPPRPAPGHPPRGNGHHR